MTAVNDMMALVDEFAHNHQLLLDPLHAFNECYTVSRDFCMFVTARFLNDRLACILNMYEPMFERSGYNSSFASSDHSIVWAVQEKLAIDFTARQYRYDVPFPLIQNKAALEGEWKKIHWDSVTITNIGGYSICMASVAVLEKPIAG